MSGDFSRNTYAPAKDFSLVRMQQGRLFTDADWNELGDILRAAERASAAAIIGPAGFPQDNAGFALRYDAAAATFVIGPGEAYLNGIRLALAAPDPVQLTKLSGAGVDTTWTVVAAQGLATGDVLVQKDLAASPLHRVTDLATVNGAVQVKTAPALPNVASVAALHICTTSTQPYAPNATLPAAAGRYLAFLLTTELPVSALDDSALREVAFDGPDTAIRDRTAWRVGFISTDALKALGAAQDPITCSSFEGPLDLRADRGHPGLLAARAETSGLDAGPCTLPPAAGYRSLDNQLYRVEVHSPGPNGAATYKWSRDNAIHRTRYSSVDAGVLLVESTGRDAMTVLRQGDWIEIADQANLFNETPGFMARIEEVNGQRVSLAEILDPLTLLPVTLNGTPDTNALPRAAFVTRWEGGKPVPIPAFDPAGWAKLENGVEVQFSAGTFVAGDYWTIPARYLTGDVEWPRHALTGAPLPLLRQGGRHSFAALALVNRDAAGAWSIEDDCRRFFAPLTALKTFDFAGGDGQEVMPDTANPAAMISLPHPLATSVLRGKVPVAGERVRYTVQMGNGRFENGLATFETLTNPQGLAFAKWSLDGTNSAQRVAAEHLDKAGQVTHRALMFGATLRTAGVTSFDPTGIPDLAAAHDVQSAIKILQSAIKILAETGKSGCSTYVLTPDDKEGWIGVLEGLKPGEDASICFTRGVYKTDHVIQLAGLGHIDMHGSGGSGSRLIGSRVETVLSFTDCASVNVSDLDIAAPDGTAAMDPKTMVNRGGALMMTRCDTVTVRDAMLSCGSGAEPERTCLNIRGYSGIKGTATEPTARVIVTDNSFVAGHLQDALLISDAIDCKVAGNVFSVQTKPKSLDTGKLLKSKSGRAMVLDQFISSPKSKGKASSNGEKSLVAGSFAYSIASLFPQGEWDTLARDNPPEPKDLKSEASFKAYGDRLVGMVIKDPKKLPSFDKEISSLEPRIGSFADGKAKEDLRAKILFSGDAKVGRILAPSPGRNAITLEADGQRLDFLSVVTQGDWRLAMTRARGAVGLPAAKKDLLAQAQQLAIRMVSEAEFRKDMASVEKWLAKFRDETVSVGAGAITCAGGVLDTVQISGNVIRNYQLGIKVATSFHSLSKKVARSVWIADNRMQLMAQRSDSYVPYGLFVGNVDTLRIEGNDLGLSANANFTQYFRQGIRVWGLIGLMVNISRNRISLATMGVRVQHSDVAIGDLGGRRWIFAENLIEGPKSLVPFYVVPKLSHVFRDNFSFSV